MSDKNGADKTGTIIYNDLLEKCKRMTDEQFGQTMRLILQYAKTQQQPDINDPLIGMAFDFIQPSIDKDIKSYKETCKKNKEAAEKRWGKKYADAHDRIPNDADALDRIPNDADAHDRIPNDAEALDRIPNDADVYDRIPSNADVYDCIPSNAKNADTDTDTVTDTDIETLIEISSGTGSRAREESIMRKIGEQYRAAFGALNDDTVIKLGSLVVSYGARDVAAAIETAAQRKPLPEHPLNYIAKVCADWLEQRERLAAGANTS